MPKQSIWTISGNQVLRHGLPIADITRFQNGKMQWSGMGLQRRGFHSEQELLQDVMYFHQHWVARQRRRQTEESAAETASAAASSAASVPASAPAVGEGPTDEGAIGEGAANA